MHVSAIARIIYNSRQKKLHLSLLYKAIIVVALNPWGKCLGWFVIRHNNDDDLYTCELFSSSCKSPYNRNFLGVILQEVDLELFEAFEAVMFAKVEVIRWSLESICDSYILSSQFSPVGFLSVILPSRLDIRYAGNINLAGEKGKDRLVGLTTFQRNWLRFRSKSQDLHK